MDLLCKLTPPSELLFVQGLGDRLTIGGRHAVFDVPTWSTKPDLLIEPKSREFLGMAFFYAEECNEVPEMLRETDQISVRYGHLLPPNWRQHYSHLTPKTSVLEIVWAQRPIMRLCAASLSGGDQWYLTEDQPGGIRSVLALGVLDIASVLEENGLIPPKEFVDAGVVKPEGSPSNRC